MKYLVLFEGSYSTICKNENHLKSYIIDTYSIENMKEIEIYELGTKHVPLFEMKLITDEGGNL